MSRICFLVGSMAISGGTYVIVQHASFLHNLGHDVTLAVQEKFNASTVSWHDRASNLRCIPIAEAKDESFDLVIATWWKTALELAEFDSRAYAYFIQSIESRFYPSDEGPLRALVDSTYDLPIKLATEALWIQRYLTVEHTQTSALIRNGIRKDVYRLDGPAVAPRDPSHPRVLVEGPFGVPFKNTALAIRLAKKAGAKDIWVLTSSPAGRLPGVSRVFSRMAMNDTPSVYRSCDILLKLSTVEGMFGPPLEMFHCGGTSVVFNVTGHDEYIIHGQNSLVVPTGDVKGVVRSLEELLCDRSLLKKLSSAATETARGWPSWDQSSAAFATWVDECLLFGMADRTELRKRNQTAWEVYGREEQQRLKDNPGVVRRYKLRAFASRVLPPVVARSAKRLECRYEVVFGKNLVR